MNFLCTRGLLQFQKSISITPVQYAIQTSSYAVAVGMKNKRSTKKTQVAEKKKIPVETDTNKLVNYCCGSNYFLEGEDVKLKPDSEYPEWLWNLRTGPPPPIEELDQNTKQYWRRLRREGILRKIKLAKYKYK